MTTQSKSINAIPTCAVLATSRNKPCLNKVRERKRKNKDLLPADPVERLGGKKKKPKDYTATETINFNTCDHDDQSNYRPVTNSSYFKVDYLQKRVYAPKQCAVCSILFGSVDYKVGSKQPVHACDNSQNVNHPCVHAYCKLCFAEIVLKACCFGKQGEKKIITTAV